MTEPQASSAVFSREYALSRCDLASPQVVVPLDVKPDDMIAGNRYFGKRRFWIKILLTQILMLALVIGMLFWGKRDALSLGDVVLYGGLYVLVGSWLLVADFSGRKTEEQKIRAEYEATPEKERLLGFLILAPEGYAVIQRDRGESFRWSLVGGIVDLGERLFLINYRGNAHIIARHMFPNTEQFAEFVTLLTTYYNDSKKAPPASGAT